MRPGATPTASEPVARLHAAPELRAQLDAAFEVNCRLRFHLARAWLSATDPVTGHPRKRLFGQWMLKLFGPVKESVGRMRREREALLRPWRDRTPPLQDLA